MIAPTSRTSGRRRRAAASWLVAAALSGAAASAGAAGVEANADALVLAHGLFDRVQVYRPGGIPRAFVLMFGGQDGFGAADRRRAQHLAASGLLVAGIDPGPFYAKLGAQGGTCGFVAGAIENLAHHLQAQLRLPTYLTPMLAGRGAGAVLAYAALAQGEPGVFGPTVSLDFCPRWPYAPPLCSARALKAYDAPRAESASAAGPASGTAPSLAALPSELRPGPRLGASWLVLAPAAASPCAGTDAAAFVRAVPGAVLRELPADGDAAADAAWHEAVVAAAATAPAPLPSEAGLADLPLVELPPTAPGARVAVLLSGDGGWAGIDKQLAAALAARGVPVVGFDSLRYFWSERTADGLARDLERVIVHYLAKWNRSEVLLIGFSQGADVLPFALNRLVPAARARIRLTALLSLGRNASFEFHVANWLGPSGDRPVEPEAVKLDAAEVLCVWGELDRESLCPRLAPAHAQVLRLPGSHHFDGDYERLAGLILERVRP